MLFGVGRLPRPIHPAFTFFNHTELLVKLTCPRVHWGPNACTPVAHGQTITPTLLQVEKVTQS